MTRLDEDEDERKVERKEMRNGDESAHEGIMRPDRTL